MSISFKESGAEIIYKKVWPRLAAYSLFKAKESLLHTHEYQGSQWIDYSFNIWWRHNIPIKHAK